MIPFRKSLGFRLLCLSVIVLALPLLVDSFILVNKRYKQTINDAKKYLVEVAQIREIPLTQIQPIYPHLARLISHYFELENSFPQTPQKELNEELKNIVLAGGGQIDKISFIKITKENRYIVVAASNGENIGKDQTAFFDMEDFLSEESIEKGYTHYIHFEDKNLNPHFIIAYIILSKEKVPIGIISIESDLEKKIDTLLMPETSEEYPVFFALMYPSSVVFAASDPDLRFHYFQPINSAYRKMWETFAGKARFLLAKKPLDVTPIGLPFFEFAWKGEKQIGYLRQLPEANFSILAYASKKNIFEAPFITFFNIYSVYGSILILGTLCATLITIRMAKPMRHLSGVMEGIQKGNLSLRYKPDFLGFEINSLGIIFNEMVEAILEQRKVAEKERIEKETLARELLLGQQVQRELLPQKMPSYSGVELSATYVPAIEVGGDFFDAFITTKDQEEKLVLAIADASGKGVQACFYSLAVRNLFRTYVKELDDIALAMEATNKSFLLDTEESGMFVTLLGGVYNKKTKQLNYYSCGHNPAICKRKSGKIEILQHTGMALGVFPFQKLKADHIKLWPGDTLVFYTDGITEAHNTSKELYGETRLIECLKRDKHEHASDLLKAIIDDVQLFVGQATQHDDITLLVMKMEEHA